VEDPPGQRVSYGAMTGAARRPSHCFARFTGAAKAEHGMLALLSTAIFALDNDLTAQS
jgi:hypothetical protein